MRETKIQTLTRKEKKMERINVSAEWRLCRCDTTFKMEFANTVLFFFSRNFLYSIDLLLTFSDNNDLKRRQIDLFKIDLFW